MKINTKYTLNIAVVTLLVVISMFMVWQPARAALLEFADSEAQNTYLATGQTSDSVRAPDFNMATSLYGESSFFDRLLTILFNCTPVSTTTDSIINVGEATLAWYWVTGQDASSSVVFYDALQQTTAPKIAEWGIPASSTVPAFPLRLLGAHFSTGIYMDVTLSGNGRVNLCYNNAS